MRSRERERDQSWQKKKKKAKEKKDPQNEKCPIFQKEPFPTNFTSVFRVGKKEKPFSLLSGTDPRSSRSPKGNPGKKV